MKQQDSFDARAENNVLPFNARTQVFTYTVLLYVYFVLRERERMSDKVERKNINKVQLRQNRASERDENKEIKAFMADIQIKLDSEGN